MKIKSILLLGVAGIVLAHPHYRVSHGGIKSLDEPIDSDDIEERAEECYAPTKKHTTTQHHSTSTHHSTSVKPTTTSKAVVVPVPATTSADSKLQTTTSKPTASADPVKSVGKNKFTSNGIKAGLSGYPTINLYATEGMDAFAKYIGWYSDYTATTPDYGNVVGVPMLWGDGNHCVSTTNVTKRVQDFYTVTKHNTPKLMFGFYEPDCDCPMSSDMSNPVYGAQKWNEMLAPLAKKGTILGSPPMCKQSAEDWLTPFKAAGLDADWDVTSIHVNVADLAGVKKDVEHYASTYGKPIWVSEFACVHAGNGFFNPCTDQNEIDHFINTVVPWLEANETVVAYGASNGEGLGDTWPLFNGGALTHTGTTYLNALKNLKK